MKKMSALQTKKNLLEQTVRLEEEERIREEEEEQENLKETDKLNEVQATAAARLKSQMILQKEEAQREQLLEEVRNDPTVPRSLVKLLAEQNGNYTENAEVVFASCYFLLLLFQRRWLLSGGMVEEPSIL